jgi:hypothetical protein
MLECSKSGHQLIPPLRCTCWWVVRHARAYAHCKDTIPEIQNKYSQERNCAATVPIPTSMFLWAIYIFLWSVCLFCCRWALRGNI